MRRLLAITALSLSLLAGPAPAQQAADTPVMGSSAAEAPEASARSQILVIGDALGGGLGAGLQRMADTLGGYDVVLRFNEESGLARPEVYDWSATLPKILASGDYDIIVVQIGSNDRQQIRDGNMRYVFNTPQWQEAYVARLDKVLAQLKAAGAQVYWVGLPPMADAEYDAAMQVISGLQKQSAEALGATYIDMRQPFLAADGSYTDTGADDTGEVRKLRGRDGVSFFKQGNNRMGQIVLSAIGQSPAPAKATATGEPAQVAAARTLLPVRSIPLFGQASILGEPLLTTPDPVFAAAIIALGPDGEGRAPAEAWAAVVASTTPGSNAAKLFLKGEAMPAPAGRLDDDRAPPPAE